MPHTSRWRQARGLRTGLIVRKEMYTEKEEYMLHEVKHSQINFTLQKNQLFLQ